MESMKNDVGMSWKSVDLVTICDFQGGTQPPKSEWSSKKTDGFIRMIQIRDFTQGKESFIEYVKDNNKLKKCSKDDIMIGRYGASIGKILTGIEGAYNVALVKTIPSSELDKKYFFHYLNTPYFQNFIQNAGSRAAQAGFNKEELKELQIPLPPLPIQKRIAEILDAADALKRKDQALLKKYDELAQAIFIDMFGDPVKNEKGWEVKTIGESIDFMTSGSRGWAQYYSKNGDLFLRINNVGYNEMKLQDLIYVTAPNNAEAIRTEIKSGDILLSITADLGRTCVIPDNFPKAFINQHLAILRLKKEYEPFFVSQVLSSEFGKLQFKKLNKGGVKAGLNFDDIKSLEFINPPIKNQANYKKLLVEVLKQSDEIIAVNKKSENLFQTLIQKAFKGELVAE
jgi:type I restriction enzyme S subunit